MSEILDNAAALIQRIHPKFYGPEFAKAWVSQPFGDSPLALNLEGGETTTEIPDGKPATLEHQGDLYTFRVTRRPGPYAFIQINRGLDKLGLYSFQPNSVLPIPSPTNRLLDVVHGERPTFQE